VAYAELQSVRKTRQDLVDGEQKLKSMLARLSDEERSLLATHDSLVDKRTELQRVLANAPRDDQMNIGRHPRLLHDHRRRADEIIAPTTPLHKQLMRAFVEDSALEDAIYNMGQALKRGTIMLDVYLKQVRDLSREQFLARATMHKCRQVAGLNAT
jgi:ESCRT-I complex subunit TSG101